MPNTMKMKKTARPSDGFMFTPGAGTASVDKA